MSVLPFLGAAPPEKGELPTLTEWACDFGRGRLLVENGKMRKVTGIEAVRVWAWHALMTPLARFDAYGKGYGSELDSLLGLPLPASAVRGTVEQIARDALLQSPYITAVSDVETLRDGDQLRVSLTLNTVYGETKMEVTNGDA